MLMILRILAVVAALAAGCPLGALLVQIACTTPLFGYCGGHAYAGLVYLSFMTATSVLLWLVFKTLVNRWAVTRLPTFHME